MGRKRNTFSKAIKHLKSTRIDEKLQVLNEIPTNSTSGLYSLVPNGLTRVEIDRKNPTVPDYDTIDWDVDGSDGKDTSGLFDGSGESRFIAPPGDNSYIQGPMSAMYYTWSYPWTTIGYIRESDRRMVNLGRIDGKLGDWDGSTGNSGSGTGTFYSYGQLTVEQALWFRDTQKKDNAGNDPDNANYRAFYPGPPSNTADAFGRYLCTITGTPKVQKDNAFTRSPIDLNVDSNFSAIMDKQSKGIPLSSVEKSYLKNRDLLKTFGDPTNNNILQGIVNTTRVFLDNIQFGGSKYLYKGLPSGIDYLPSFTGGNPFGGWKMSDLLPKSLVGGLYDVQYFTPAVNKSIQYSKGKLWDAIPKFWAKTPGQVITMPNTQAVRSWKNALRLPMSRGFGFGDVEKIVKTSTAVANTNVTRIFDLAKDTIQVNPKVDKVTGKVIKGSGSVHQLSKGSAKKVLQNMAKKGIKTMGITGRLLRIVPLLNIPLVAADVTSRLKSGDYYGALMGAAQIVGGPIGLTALAAQVAYDVDGHFNKNGLKQSHTSTQQRIWIPGKGTVDLPFRQRTEGYIMEEGEEQEQISTQGLGQALKEMGLPKDKNEFIQDIGFYLLLQGVNPQFLGMYLRALAGEKLSTEQEQWIQENIPVMVNGMSDIYENGEGEEPLYTEDDPWALRKQQTQEGVNVSEERKLSILKNLKKPVVIPETKQKSYKVSPGKRLNQKTNFQGMDKLIGDTKLQKTFKKPQDIWSQDWQGYNAKLSQNKKNEVLELIGDGKHAFDYMLTDSKAKNAEEMEKFWGLHPELYSYNFNGKKYKATRKEQIKGDYVVFLVDETGKKSSMLQSTLNEKMAEEEEKEMLDEYNKLNSKNEPIPYEKDPLFKKVAKRLKNEIDYPDKPAAKGYPNEPPPKMVKGWHPEYGKRYKYDKLDPVSAVAMRNAPTGNPEIDANVEKAARKPKI